MAQRKDQKHSIKFKYIFTEDYNPVYVNGAYGGSNPRGEFVIHFFHERPGLPITQTYDIDTESAEVKLIEDRTKRMPLDQAESIVRFVQTGIVLSYQSAKELSEWLKDHIDRYKDQQKTQP